MSGLVSDRAIEHEGKIIGHVWKAPVYRGRPEPPMPWRARTEDYQHVTGASTYEAAVAWLMEQHAKEQA